MPRRLFKELTGPRREQPVIHRDFSPRRKQRRARFPEYFDRYSCFSPPGPFHADLHPEIYRIVSSKALDNGEAGQNPNLERKVLEISKSADTEKPSGKCC